VKLQRPLARGLFRTADERPTRAAYALPTIFTAGNLFLGYLAITKTIQGALVVSSGQTGGVQEWEDASKMIGIAVALDGLDGRIARMTDTVSEFGREIDSLADVITFGIAPSVLAFCWGVMFVDGMTDQVRQAGYFFAFAFLLCGALRLARFNVTLNPIPQNPGNPLRKYFVGLPIPAGAGVIASIVYFMDSRPIRQEWFSIIWIGLLALLAYLMVCTWRYRSFKDFDILRPRTLQAFLLLAGVIFAIWLYPKPLLLLLGSSYMLSGIIVRIGGLMRRKFSSKPPEPNRESAA
jgi:CDP-diacylglycerol---serine O-phosphatidyltransferase